MFENVCELDMVYFPHRVIKTFHIRTFHKNKYYFIKINALIDEIIIGGHVIETKISEVLQILN